MTDFDLKFKNSIFKVYYFVLFTTNVIIIIVLKDT